MDHFVEPLRAHALGSRQIPNEARVEIAGARAHGDAGTGGEAHAGVDAFAVADGGKTGAVTEVGHDYTTSCRFGSSEAFQFFHEKRVGETVKPKALNPFRIEATWYRQ